VIYLQVLHGLFNSFIKQKTLSVYPEFISVVATWGERKLFATFHSAVLSLKDGAQIASLKDPVRTAL
jgi:hypothetical protein